MLMKKILSCLLCIILIFALFTANAADIPKDTEIFEDVHMGLTSNTEKQVKKIEPAPSVVDPSKPMIALTFDDGPSKHTPRILDMLERYGGRATFFTVGYLLNAHSETVLRAHNMGCEIIGHTWDHSDLTKLSDWEIKNQLVSTSNAIKNITGTEIPMYRPPYGSMNERVRRVSGELGFSTVTWSLDTKDWKTRNVQLIYLAVMQSVKAGDIIIAHDMHGTTADAMEYIIPALVKQGYQLVTVSELLTDKYGSIQAGIVYTN